MIPPEGYQATSQQYTYWMGTGGWITFVKRALGDDDAFSVILSRVAREMRRTYGPDQAKALFLEFAESMHEAAAFDLPDC